MAQFRSRSQTRDAETDKRRMGDVLAAAEVAARDAVRERDGLRSRIAAYQAQAASLMDAAEYGDRNSAEEAAIRNVEVEIIAGLARIDDLDQHIARLGEIAALAR